MQITSKGQVTIPQDIREKAGMLPGGEVAFILKGGNVMIRSVTGRGRRGKAIVRHLQARAGTRIRMSTDEIMALTRG